jgi:voltage-gated potassium channel
MRRRGESFVRERAIRAVARRRIFPYLAGVTFVIAFGAGVLVTIVDGKDFPTLEDGVWWAVVTLGTVGYGDLVPTTTTGRIVGSLLIIFGVTFISFLTATVTSAFVSAEQAQAHAADIAREEEAEAELRRILLEMSERLTAIEAKLERG